VKTSVIIRHEKNRMCEKNEAKNEANGAIKMIEDLDRLLDETMMRKKVIRYD
jgi:hypothetical protein